MGSYWHPFADMAALERDGELVIESGEGVWVRAAGGERLLDATAALWYCNVGYGRAEIADAVAAQMRRLPAYSNFGDLATRPTGELAERVASLAPQPGSKVFFTSGGSDAVDSAAKLARRYWQLRGSGRKTLVISRGNAYHGMHAFGTSLGGIEANRDGYGTLVADVAQVRWDSADALEQAIEGHGAGGIAAFFCEPVICAGGVLAPPEGYLAEVRRICREHEILFVADEVVCGFGRVGDWFASSRYALEPDLITCAKGITSGYLPLGAVIAAPAVAEPFFDPRAPIVWRHGYTYSGHASVAAAALANLDIIEREGLIVRARLLEQELAEALQPLRSAPLVADVRCGTGVLAAVVLERAAVAAAPGLVQGVVSALRRRGVLTRALGSDALQISPSLVVEPSELDFLVEALQGALDDVADETADARAAGAEEALHGAR